MHLCAVRQGAQGHESCPPEQALVQLVAARDQLPNGRQQIAQHGGAPRGAIPETVLIHRPPLQRARQHLHARADLVKRWPSLRRLAVCVQA